MCRPKEKGGRRCPAHSAASRRTGRAAVRLYGRDNKSTRAIIESLPKEYVYGTIAERAKIASTTTDPKILQLAAWDPKKPVNDAFAENRKRRPMPKPEETTDQAIMNMAARDPKPAADILPHALTSGLSLADLGVEDVQAGEVTIKADKSNEIVQKIPASLITEMVRDNPSDFSLPMVLATSEGAKDYIVHLTTHEWDLVRGRLGDEAFQTDSHARLAILAEVDDHRVRSNVFGNPKLPTAVLDAAVQNESVYFRQLAMDHSNMSDTSFNKFAKDADSLFRGQVAASPRATPETLATLATDEDQSVRRRVASNETVHPDVLSALSQDTNDTVRGAVAENLRTPHAVLTALENDSEPLVRESANAAIKNRDARKEKS